MKRNLYLLLAFLMLTAALTGCGGSEAKAPQDNLSQTSAVTEEPAAEPASEPAPAAKKESQERALIYENEHVRVYLNELYPSMKDANLELENKDPGQAYRVIRSSGSKWLEGDLTVNGVPMITNKPSFDLEAGGSKRAQFGTDISKMKANGIEAITDLEFKLDFYPAEPGEGEKTYQTGGASFSTGILHVTFGEDRGVLSFEELPEALPEQAVILDNEHVRISVSELFPDRKNAFLTIENKDPEQAYRAIRTSGSKWLEGDLTVNSVPMITDKPSFDLEAGGSERAQLGIIVNKMKDNGIEAITDLEFKLDFYPTKLGEGGKTYRIGGASFSTGILHVTFGENREVLSFEELPEALPEQAVVFDNEHVRISVSELFPDRKNAILTIENRDPEQAYRIERTSGSQWIGGDLLINGMPQNTDETELDLLSGDILRATFGTREAKLKEAGIEAITDIEFSLKFYPGEINHDDGLSWKPTSVVDTKTLHVTFGEDGKVQSSEQRDEAFPEHTVLVETDVFRLSVIMDAVTGKDICFITENTDPERDIIALLYPGEKLDGWETGYLADGVTVKGRSEFFADHGETKVQFSELGQASGYPFSKISFRVGVVYGVPSADGGMSFDPNTYDAETAVISIDIDENGNLKITGAGETVRTEAEPVLAPADEELTQEEKDFYEALRLYFDELDYKGAYKLLKPYKNPTIGAMAAFMGDCNYLGKGTGENNNEAYRLYSLAADLGSGLGYYGKAMCTNFGYGVKKDQDAAKELFKTAVELLPGEIDSYTDPHLKGLAAFYLGRIHYYGLMDGVRSSREAMPYLEQAAEYHNPNALELLGEYNDNNGHKDKAVLYFAEAADYGDAGGAYNAGMMYLNGEGTEQNGELAVKYLQMAADRGISEARSKLNEAKKLQKEQQSAADNNG